MVKVKKNKTFKLINRIINPIVPIHDRFQEKINEFYFFTHNYKHDNFEDVFKVIIKDEEIKSKLAFFQVDKSKLLNATLFDLNKLTMERILVILKLVFESNLDEIIEYSKVNEDIEFLLSTNCIDEVLDKLNYIDNKYRVTLWSINIRVICLSLKGCDPDVLYDICNDYARENDSEILADSLACIVGRNIVSDVVSHVKSNEYSKVKELYEGNAKSLSSYFSIITGVSSIDHDVVLSYALPMFTLIPLYDAYKLTVKAISNDFIHEIEKLSPESVSLIRNFVNSFEKCDNLKDFTNMKNIVNGVSKSNLQISISDNEYINYCKGDFNNVIDSFEINCVVDKNIMSKINLIAKSYVKENRYPSSNVPILLSEVINNLIKIYTLNNSSQSISNILSLAYRFNQLEISYHLIVAIIKSAPYYFNENDYKSIYKSACLSTIPVTTLTLNLGDKFIIQNEIKDVDKSRYLNIKESLWRLLKENSDNCVEIEEYLNLIKNETSITKDYLELIFEYYLQYNKFNEAIELASNYLTKNRESVFCIPMYKLANLIATGEYVGIAPVIVAYFYESEHRMQSDDLLKDAFEEYLILNDDKSPSQILDDVKELSELEVFFYLNICTSKLISYQGIYSNPSELSMERLKILNLLEVKKVAKEYTSELIRECMDEIIIAEGLTRISNSRININTLELTNAILPQVESLMDSYHELPEASHENALYPLKSSKSIFFTKGEKNKIIKKIINSIRLEFLDNPDYGLDKMLSSRIRHAFFSDEICRKSIEKKLIVEYDKNGNFESRYYWLEKYHFVNDHILKDINKILNQFNVKFYSLIDKAENWMKISKNDGELVDSEFDFTFSIDIEHFKTLETKLDNNVESVTICSYIFEIYEKYLADKLESIQLKLMDTFCNEMDSIFNDLINDIESVKRGVAFSELFDAIFYVKNGIREDIKTSSDWFSIDNNNYEDNPIEVSKLIKISELFLERSHGSKRCLKSIIDYDYFIPSNHTSLVNLSIINILSNAFKYAKMDSCVQVKVEPYESCGFKMEISNSLSIIDFKLLKEGKLKEIQDTLTSQDSLELLRTEGGTGIFKSLYELKLASEMYELSINIDNNSFNVEVFYHG